MKKAYLSVMTAFFAVIAFGQDATKSVDVNINTKSQSNWYANPIVWVVGAAVFILLLVALMRGRNRD
jgi:apolipoprotein N-acyltransferase